MAWPAADRPGAERARRHASSKIRGEPDGAYGLGRTRRPPPSSSSPAQIGLTCGCQPPPLPVVRHPGAPVGKRTDIFVNTLRRSETGEPIDPIAAVVEAKGCWNDELFTALGTQLVGDYMVQLAAPVGIYLVGWFDLVNWDRKDSRRRRVPKRAIDEVRQQLEGRAAAAPEGFLVRAVVIEIGSP